MTFSCAVGETLLPPKHEALPNINHLWVILTEPQGAAEEVIVANLTDQDDHIDQTVMLNVGCHPFVVKPTVIAYGEAKIRAKKDLLMLVAKGLVIPRQPFTGKLIMDIQKGICASLHTKNKVKNFWRNRV